MKKKKWAKRWAFLRNHPVYIIYACTLKAFDCFGFLFRFFSPCPRGLSNNIYIGYTVSRGWFTRRRSCIVRYRCVRGWGLWCGWERALNKMSTSLSWIIVLTFMCTSAGFTVGSRQSKNDTAPANRHGRVGVVVGARRARVLVTGAARACGVVFSFQTKKLTCYDDGLSHPSTYTPPGLAPPV